MALINCEECGKEISDKAASCPGCGAPVAMSEKTTKESNQPAPNKQPRRKGSGYRGCLICFVGLFALLIIVVLVPA